MQLYKSGYNIEKVVFDFIGVIESITLYCAYIKLNELKLININSNLKQIIVRWEIEDLCKGVSDLALYDYCKKYNIALYRNTRIHMKAIWNNENTVIFGSSNISAAGLGMCENYNYELNGICDSMTLNDKKYLYEVITASELVTEELYEKIKTLVESVQLPTVEYPKLPTVKKETDYFLLSQLPMSLSPENLYHATHHSHQFATLEINCAAHDLAIYNVIPYQEFGQFIADLSTAFNSHSFIIALKNHIKSQPNQSLRYGGVVSWIQINTTTVPTPRSWEVKKEQIVNILYEWICYFDEGFTWDKPRHSQVIRYKNN